MLGNKKSEGFKKSQENMRLEQGMEGINLELVPPFDSDGRLIVNNSFTKVSQLPTRVLSGEASKSGREQ